MAFLLRVASEDVAVVIGQWKGGDPMSENFKIPSFFFLVRQKTREGRKCHYLVVSHGFSTCFDLFGDCYNMKHPHCLVPNKCKSRPPWVYASVYITLGGWLMGLFGGKSNTYPAMPAAGVSKVIGTLLNFEHASPAYPKFLHPKWKEYEFIRHL